MTLSEIRTLLRYHLDEATAGFWADAELNTYINIANKKLNSLIKELDEDAFTKIVTFSTVSGTKRYTLPSDFGTLRRIEVYDASDSSDVTRIAKMDFPFMERSGTWPFGVGDKPYYYVIIKDHIDFYPTPNAVYTIRMWYDIDTATLSGDSDTPTSPAEFHDMIAIWASALALLKNAESSQEFKDMWAIRANDLISEFSGHRGVDSEMTLGYLEGE